MRAASVVAVNVFRESVRDRVPYNLVLFAVLLIVSSFLLGQLTAGQDVKIIKDLGLAAIEFSGILMAIFIGISLVAREIERRSVFGLLTKPLARWQFIVGKYVGLVLTILVNVAAMTVVFFVVLAWLGWAAPENVRQSWAAPAADVRLLVAIVEIVAELALLTAVALFFSTFSSSTLLSVALTVGVLIAGQLSGDLRRFGDLVDAPAALTMVVTAAGWLLPAFSAFDDKSTVVSGLPLDAGRVAYTLVYGALYSAAAVAASVAVFARREFR